jgi:hypothetical protein
LRGAAGFYSCKAHLLNKAPWANPVKAITAELAADLGYR